MDEENNNVNSTSNCEDEEKKQEEEEEEDKVMEMDGREVGEQQQIQENFAEIPELPAGKVLRLELLSPWDDPNFVGIGAIELFTNEGIRPAIDSIWTNAVESSGELNGLIIVQHGKHNKNNVGNMWLCNYRQRPQSTAADSVVEPIYIGIQFEQPQTTLAMIRIWNYSDSRVHALRGVRNLRIWLDEQCIFQGEICCAFATIDIGQCGKTPQGDTILFTTNEEILAKIAEHDEEMLDVEDIEKMKPSEKQSSETSILRDTDAKLMPDQQLATLLTLQQKARESSLNCLTVPNRPTTGHTNQNNNSSNSSSASSTSAGRKTATGDDKMQELLDEEEENLCVGKIFHMELLANWGSPDSIGLTGIQFLGPNFEPLNDVLNNECQVRCEPQMESSIGGIEGELTNLLNGRNLTIRKEEMWLMPLATNIATEGGPNSKQQNVATLPVLSFTFPHEVRISGISIWNYNASPELSYVGVRYARFYANGRPINGVNSVLLRKAPGFVFFDFVQDILFDRCPLLRPISNSRPHTRSVAGFIFQVRLLSSWGDEFYIGLNGIELFDRRDQEIRLRPQNLAAFPESVNCLATVHDDPRTSDKLIDGFNDTAKAHHMWLTPILPNSYARIFIIFDTPTFVTRIRIFNYRKTPERGLSVDDLLLCSGTEVPMSTKEETGILDISLRDSE